jgi:hypothetical protein
MDFELGGEVTESVYACKLVVKRKPKKFFSINLFSNMQKLSGLHGKTYTQKSRVR